MRNISEHKKNLMKYTAIIQTALDGFYITDLKGQFLDINDSYCKMIGYTREELLKMSIPDVEIIKEPEETAHYVKKVMEQGYDRFETCHRHKDGHHIDVEVSVNYLDVEGGQLLVSLRDITERKLAEKVLKKAQENINSIFSNLKDAVFVISEDFEILFKNKTAHEIFSENLLGKKCYNVIKGLKNPCERCPINEFKKNDICEYRYEQIVKLPEFNEPKFFDVLAIPIKNYSGKPAIVELFRDRTENRKLRNNLKEQNKRYSQLLKELEIIIDSIPGLVFSKDDKNNYIRVNKYVADAYKLKKSELEEKNLFDLLKKEQAQAQWDDDLEVIKSNEPKLNIEEPWETEKGLRWVKTSKIPYIDEDKNVKGIIGISLDITDLKDTELKEKRQREITSTITEILRATLTTENIGELTDFCLEVSGKLVGAKFGYFGEVNEQGTFDILAISNAGWMSCDLPKDKVELLIKNMEIRGMQFLPLKDGISRIFNNPRSHPQSIGIPDGHPEITSLLAVPMKYDDKIIGQISLGNKEGGFNAEDKEAIELLSVAIVESILKKRTEIELAEYRQHLEEIIEKRTEELKQSEGKFQSIIENLPEGFYSVSLNGTLLEHNKAFNKILGFDPEKNIKGTNMPEFWQDPKDREPYTQELIKIGFIKDYIIKAKKYNGEKMILKANSRIILDSEGKPSRIEGTVSDVTRELKFKKILTNSEANFRNIFENSPIALWNEDLSDVKRIIDNLKDVGIENITTYIHEHPEILSECISALKIIAVNNSALIMFGAKSKEEILENINKIFTKERTDALKEEIIQLNEGNNYFETETAIGTLTGQVKNVIIRLTIVPGYQKNWGKILISIIDITKIKKFEEELKIMVEDLTRSNEELEQFAYIASHDLQEPLRMVASFTQLLQRRYQDKLDKDANDFINYTIEGTTRMQSLINDLLLYSRVGTGGKPFYATDMNIVFESVKINLSTLITESNAKVTSDLLPVIIADDIQMIQLLQNLISNAIKFNNSEIPIVHITGEAKENSWEFSVKDNGIGIDSQYFDLIFIIFQRLHKKDEYKGTGIGLALCKKIVQRHGGKMWIESEIGKGSAFYFSIPKRKSRSYNKNNKKRI